LNGNFTLEVVIRDVKLMFVNECINVLKKLITIKNINAVKNFNAGKNFNR